MSADQPGERTGTRRGLAGRVLGDRYRVVRMVSAGANTLIAEADDTELDRPVTIKLVRPEWAESADFRRRFRAEMRAMSSISHPNIAAVYDWGEEQIGKRTTVYAVVEYLSGGSLRDLFDRGRYLDPSQALMVGLEACRGLDYAHRKGLVHTELTPAKLVFGDDRRLRIVDFGLARLLGEHDWTEPARVAAHVARYSSPEQALAQPIDGKSDVYSLALILVEAVTGSVPFAARSGVATLSARIGRLMPVSADLGPLASVLERAGRPEPADRSTASELGRALVGAAEKLPRPKPIPVMTSSLFQDDPNQMRRPNDPTGGITRPPVDPTETPLVVVPAARADGADGADGAGGAVPGTETADGPPTGAPVDRSASAAVAAAEAVAAIEAIEAIEDESTEATGGPAGGHTTDGAPLPPPVVLAGPDAATTAPAAASVGEPSSPPQLYDGEVDRTRDELAALARPADVVDGGAEGLPASASDTAAVVGPPIVADPGAPTADGSPPAGWSSQLETLDEGRPRRRRWLVWLSALVVLGALAGLGYLAYTLFRVPTHPVPELVGLDEAAARSQTADFDWDIDIQQERSDEQPTVGAIIRTAPSAGEELAEGEPFLVVVSEGPEFRKLPDLAGQPLADAETDLAELQLTALPPTEQFDEVVPVGAVISWSVPADPTLVAGGDVLPGAEVAMVVSTGPAPRTIPALSGLSVADATAQLTAIQLQAAVAEAVFSDTVPVDAVVSVDPAEGGQLARGATVTLTPSKGIDYVVMPDLTGQTLDQARATLAAAGLNVGTLLGSTQGIFVSATVAGDKADVGEQFKRGTTVDMIFF